VKIVDYPQATFVQPDNVFIMDGPDGTKKIRASDLGFINVPFQIVTTAWQPSATYPEYSFQFTLSVTGITSADLVRADFDLGSLIAAAEAGLASAGDTTNGSVIFYAKERPIANLAGMYTIFKGVI
jgi:hypothetical protein